MKVPIGKLVMPARSDILLVAAAAELAPIEQLSINALECDAQIRRNVGG
jgi:hypothetical protein